MRVLLVEDERPIASFIKKGLIAANYAVDVVHDGGEAEALIRLNSYDVLVFDYMLPNKDGLALTEFVRTESTQNRQSPILILTARDDTDSKVEALDAGADDYLTKPFEVAEFLARVRALVRRIPKELLAEGSVLEYAGLEYDLAKLTVRFRGEPVELTRKETALLEYFMRNPGVVLTRTMILEHVWDMNMDPFTNTVDVHLRNLRNKLKKAGVGRVLHTVHGVGYRLEKI